MKVHVTPALVLIARPQLVPMNTRFAFAGSIEMPKAAGSARLVSGDPAVCKKQKFAGGVALAGCVQVFPPSLLTLMPERLLARPS